MKEISNANILIESFYQSKKESGWKNSVQTYEANLLKNIRTTQLELENGTYKQKDFYNFYLFERGKKRYIRSIAISDRVVQRALCDEVLIPAMEPLLIYDNGASVKGKGIDFARNRVSTHLHKYYRENKTNEGYILLIDFSKFFDNINHKKLLELFNKKIENKEIRKLIEDLINTFSIDVSYMDNEAFKECENKLFDSLAYSELKFDKNGSKMMNKSLGIGSQISQIAGILFPTQIDNYCKIVKGYKYYGRYMDDIYLIHNNKDELRETLETIKQISKELGLFLNPKKTQIFKINKGFTFLKIRYILTETGKIIRIPDKKSFVRERRKLKKLKTLMSKGNITYQEIENQYKSWRGNISKFNCYKSVRNMDRLFNELFKGGDNYVR